MKGSKSRMTKAQCCAAWALALGLIAAPTVRGAMATTTIESDNSDTIYDVSTSYSDASGGELIITNGATVSGYYVYGGIANYSDATDNSVTVEDSSTVSSYGMYAGYSCDGDATGNKVEVNDSTVGDTYGGYAYSSSDAVYADNNEVTITNSNLTGDVCGGRSYSSDDDASGSASGNTVTIKDSTATGSSYLQNVYGGLAYNGSADNNIVILESCSADDSLYGYNVYGGYVPDIGGASYNEVYVSNTGSADDTTALFIYGGSTFDGDTSYNTVSLENSYAYTVAGGFTYDGDATYNEVILCGNVIITNYLYGGYSASDGDITGNTLTVTGSGNEVNYIYGFDTVNYYISNSMDGETMLTVESSVDLSDVTSIYVYAQDDLDSGYSVTLLYAEEGITNYNEDVVTAKAVEGVSLTYDLYVEQTDDNNIVAYIDDTTTDDTSTDDTSTDDASTYDTSTDDATTDDTSTDDASTDDTSTDDTSTTNSTTSKATMNDETKSLVETRLASVAMINSGADLIAGDVIRKTSSAPVGGRWGSFVAMSAGSYTYDTGSHVDIDGFNFAVGFARSFGTESGKLSIGAGFQYGRGDYDSYAEGVKADGDTEYSGAFLFAKHRWNSGFYAEGSIAAGYAQSDYFSSEMPNVDSVSYDDGARYTGLHVGLGKEFSLANGSALDVYGKYFFSHLNSSTSKLTSGETYEFDGIDSSRIRLGFRYSGKAWDTGSWYAGAAYEYQFEGDARGSYKGYSTLSPSVEGSSGMIEAGVEYKPKGVNNLTLGVGVTGWVGQQEGIEGSLKLKWDL